MRWFALFVAVFITWLLLTWSFDLETIIIGVVLSAISALIFRDLFIERPGIVFNPRRWFWFLLYLPVFFYYCLKANLDVMYRVIHPATPIRPGIVKVHTDLKTNLARTFLANSITLTPGTLSVDITDDGDLYVHWINITTMDEEEQRKRIPGRFEPFLRRIFE
jgi:multicomponent Na+:H+ antiporter subunit E